MWLKANLNISEIINFKSGKSFDYLLDFGELRWSIGSFWSKVMLRISESNNYIYIYFLNLFLIM